ncbi:MAG: hypothetical protein ACSHYF_05970 [Verrucomicrobiaceae bacterium]
MKPSLRDYLTILMALLAIFLCGYGVGYLLGEKKGRDLSPPLALAGNSDEDAATWEGRTVDRLNNFLALTDSQREKVESEVKTTSREIQISRDQAVEDYYLHLLDLHDRLLPHLDEQQQAKIKKDRKSLQRAINSRFKSSAE